MHRDRSIVRPHDVVMRDENSSGIVYPPVATQYTAGASGDKRELTWGELAGILRRNWLLSICIALVVFLTTGVVTALMKPVYESTARLEIDPPNTENFALKESSLPANDPDYLQTQAQVIKSDSLAIKVIRDLRLDQEQEMTGPAKQGPGLLHRFLSVFFRPKKAHLGEATDDSVGPRLTPQEARALSTYQKNLKLAVGRNANLVDITLASHDPVLAARVTNRLAADYIDLTYQNRYDSAMQATQWLSKELEDLRRKVELSNKALADFQNENGLVDLTDKTNSVTETVDQLTQHWIAARAERMRLEGDVRVLNANGIDALQEVRASNLVQDLSKMLADARSQLAEARVVYGENNTNVRKRQDQVNEAKRQLDAERQSIAKSVRASYQAAVIRERLLQSSLDGMKGRIHDMNRTEVVSASLKKQLQANEDLYNTLVTKLKEAGISAGLRSSTIRIVDRARVSEAPVKPQVTLNLAGGFLLALLAGAGIPVLKDLWRGKLHDAEDIRKVTGLLPIGVVPILADGMAGVLADPQERARAFGLNAALRKRFPQSAAEESDFVSTEAVRNLCVSILLSRPQNTPRVILVTSAMPGEGKTTISVRLARMLARSRSTCLIDGDLRNPSVTRAFGVTSAVGLGDVLGQSIAAESAMFKPGEAGELSVIAGDRSTKKAGELIASDAMFELLHDLSKQFETVIIDSPPILGFADARALSKMVDGVLVVGRAGVTSSADLNSTLETLDAVHATVLGTILNGVSRANDYYRHNRLSGPYVSRAQ